MMKRAKIQQPHQIELVDDAIPQPRANEVLLKIKAVGICGSDLHVLEGQHPFVTYPVFPGHEVSGEIVALGDKVDDSLLGLSAVIEPSIADGTLPRFQPGRYNIASELKVMGFQVPGAMSEYFTVPVNRIHILPQGLSHEVGAMVEPTAVAVHAVRLAGNIAGLRVGVIGAGTIGLLTAQVARAYNASEVMIADHDDKRRELAKTLGLQVAEALGEQQFDVVFECVGVEASMRASILACTKGGAIVVVGVFGDEARLPIGLIQDRELQILGSLMYVADDYTEAIRLLQNDQVAVIPLITHRYPLRDVQHAFDQALERGATLKVLLIDT